MQQYLLARATPWRATNRQGAYFMQGWSITITLETAQRRDAPVPIDKEAILGYWDTGSFGTNWVKHLVETGKASEHLRGGYPDRYVALARDVLPLIDNYGIAHDDYVRDVKLHRDRIAACPPEQAVTVEVWDLS
ncbi:hypothetical protein INH39_16075 [Massilia violaceinigra]|uniref:Uncharacterized protein n=1 Tax=Massilia violaceinigra TaxID=2045208 RepID=A0ABY4AE78_9BURK|nr:hypothetical protein [Massilia violaceinigra]UOD33013.1 hypothetical protein INH39_16075 [Massilia violaceinigra]